MTASQIRTLIARDCGIRCNPLAGEGFDVVTNHRGFTRSYEDSEACCSSAGLEKGNMLTNKMELHSVNGLRTGTSRLTRIRVKESDMKEIARFHRNRLIDGKRSSASWSLHKNSVFRLQEHTIELR